jgi:hypothetical protein
MKYMKMTLKSSTKDFGVRQREKCCPSHNSRMQKLNIFNGRKGYQNDKLES